MATVIPPLKDDIFIEEIDFSSPLSEATGAKMGGSINALNLGEETFRTVITVSTTYLVPPFITFLRLLGAGGGGGGGDAQGTWGGEGVVPSVGLLSVVPGETLTIVIGPGGVAGAGGGNGGNGSTTKILRGAVTIANFYGGRGSSGDEYFPAPNYPNRALGASNVYTRGGAPSANPGGVVPGESAIGQGSITGNGGAGGGSGRAGGGGGGGYGNGGNGGDDNGPIFSTVGGISAGGGGAGSGSPPSAGGPGILIITY